MRKIGLAALLFASTPTMAFQGNSPEGHFVGNHQSLDLKVLKSNGHVYAHVETSSSTGCYGTMTGEAMMLTYDTFSVSEKACTVHLFYFASGRRVHITEDTCLDNHGAACNFEGTVSR